MLHPDLLELLKIKKRNSILCATRARHTFLVRAAAQVWGSVSFDSLRPSGRCPPPRHRPDGRCEPLEHRSNGRCAQPRTSPKLSMRTSRASPKWSMRANQTSPSSSMRALLERRPGLGPARANASHLHRRLGLACDARPPHKFRARSTEAACW